MYTSANLAVERTSANSCVLAGGAAIASSVNYTLQFIINNSILTHDNGNQAAFLTQYLINQLCIGSCGKSHKSEKKQRLSNVKQPH